MKKMLLILVLHLTSIVGFSDQEFYQEFRIYSREEIFNHPVLPAQSPKKYYAEPDINGDGTNDLIFSESVSRRGTGGLPYHVYLGKGDNMYQKIKITNPHPNTDNGPNIFCAKMMALEVSNVNLRRLWFYWNLGGGSGTISYLYFDHEGRLCCSNSIRIQHSISVDEIGDVGSEILNTIFGNQNLVIEFNETEVPNQITPTSN